MYLILITISLVGLYFAVGVLFSLLFENRLPKLYKWTFLSLAIILCGSLVSYLFVSLIPDAQIANWVLHGLGGGFLALMVCFLATRDFGIDLNRLQFFVLSMLVVGALGIANEILEFILQNYAEITFAVSVNDTWYDLISNTIGSFAAALFFTPFHCSKS